MWVCVHVCMTWFPLKLTSRYDQKRKRRAGSAGERKTLLNSLVLAEQNNFSDPKVSDLQMLTLTCILLGWMVCPGKQTSKHRAKMTTLISLSLACGQQICIESLRLLISKISYWLEHSHQAHAEKKPSKLYRPWPCIHLCGGCNKQTFLFAALCTDLVYQQSGFPGVV